MKKVVLKIFTFILFCYIVFSFNLKTNTVINTNNENLINPFYIIEGGEINK